MGSLYISTYALVFTAIIKKNRAYARDKINGNDIVKDQSLSAKQKLLALKRVYEEGKITEEEYNEKRKEVIDKI